MSTAVCEAVTPMMAGSELAFSVAAPPGHPLAPLPPYAAEPLPDAKVTNAGQFDIWAAIQEAKRNARPDAGAPPYVHPLLKRSASFLSQKSLEVCTESLGSETGSDGFSDTFASLTDDEYGSDDDALEILEGLDVEPEPCRKELAAVNYHCSINSRSPRRSFPPPLPSICRRDGPCLHVGSRRWNGRLVMHAVPVPSQNYLHCHRQEGRLLLSFIETAFEEIYPDVHDQPPDVTADEGAQEDHKDETKRIKQLKQQEMMMEEEEEEEQEQEQEEEEEVEEEEEEEEEVEVVDRGITVEVKVSRQPQPQNGGAGGVVKVHKSSLVINKFVSGTPLASNREEKEGTGIVPVTAATSPVEPHGAAAKGCGVAGVVAERTGMQEMEAWGWGRARAREKEERDEQRETTRLLFSAKRMMKRQDLLHHVRRCSGHNNQRPLFIWEPPCIATTS